MKRKGIILAGGNGTRLAPLTTVVTKQLLPVYDKPLIFYPLSLLLKLDIRDILIICSSWETLNLYMKLLHKVKANITYKIQEQPLGIAHAFILGEDFIGDSNTCLVLGDNIFYGSLVNNLPDWVDTEKNFICGLKVEDPTRYGVMEFHDNNTLEKIVEKPATPPSKYAVPGLYFFDSSVVQRAKQIKPSPRGELEIVDIINSYINDERMSYNILPDDTVWFDCGNVDHLLEAGNFVAAIQKRTGQILGNIYV